MAWRYPRQASSPFVSCKNTHHYFFYLFFYSNIIKQLLPRFVISFGLFYVITHWVCCFSLYLTLQDEELTNLSKAFVRTFKDIGYFDFFSSKVVSANLYAMAFGFFPVALKFAENLYVVNLQKQMLEVESKKVELNYLRSQINPHFIFNVINNAYFYVFKRDKQSAELLLKLADIIRYTIEETGEDLISLEKEVTILQELIAIEKIRSSTHATITYHPIIESDISNVKILPLALVTLLENAIKHGVGIYDKRGFVDCTLTVTDSHIDFRVINSVNLQKSESSTGIGLANLKRRLKLVYGDGYDLSLVSGESKYEVNLRIRLS
ncbi:MAG: histidine kinase [Leadbetterella sp.]|nr:histidine kinase [Leadbetterella sp.]